MSHEQVQQEYDIRTAIDMFLETARGDGAWRQAAWDDDVSAEYVLVELQKRLRAGGPLPPAAVYPNPDYHQVYIEDFMRNVGANTSTFGVDNAEGQAYVLGCVHVCALLTQVHYPGVVDQRDKFVTLLTGLTEMFKLTLRRAGERNAQT